MKSIYWGLLAAIIIAVFISPFASSFPDGLEKVAENLNFINLAEGKEVFKAILPDYVIPIIKNEHISGPVAGVIGTLITFLAGYGVARLLRKRPSP